MRACVCHGAGAPWTHPSSLPHKDSAGGRGSCPGSPSEQVSEPHPASREGGSCVTLGLGPPHPVHCMPACPGPLASAEGCYLQTAKAPRGRGVGRASPGAWMGLCCPCHLLPPGLGLEGGWVLLALEEGIAVLNHTRGMRNGGERRASLACSGLPGSKRHLVCLWIPGVAWMARTLRTLKPLSLSRSPFTHL